MFVLVVCPSLVQKRKERVYAGRRVWEALNRPWHPFSASHHGTGKHRLFIGYLVQWTMNTTVYAATQ